MSSNHVDQLQHFWQCKRSKNDLQWTFSCTTSITRGVVIRVMLEYSHNMTGPSECLAWSYIPSPLRRRNVIQENKYVTIDCADIVNKTRKTLKKVCLICCGVVVEYGSVKQFCKTRIRAGAAFLTTTDS